MVSNHIVMPVALRLLGADKVVGGDVRTLLLVSRRVSIALVLGLVVAALLATSGPAITRSSPVMTFIALGFLFPVLGLLLAGAVSLRPDHDPMIEQTRAATQTGHWTVIAHCASHDEQARAKDAIGHSAQTL